MQFTVAQFCLCATVNRLPRTAYFDFHVRVRPAALEAAAALARRVVDLHTKHVLTCGS